MRVSNKTTGTRITHTTPNGNSDFGFLTTQSNFDKQILFSTTEIDCSCRDSILADIEPFSIRRPVYNVEHVMNITNYKTICFLLRNNLCSVDNSEQFIFKQNVGASSPENVTQRFPMMNAS
jgi:hypothetical protein